MVPVSRWTEVRAEDVDLHPDLRVLIHSDEVGPCLIDDPAHRALYMFNHLEYDATTLKEEYDRDLRGGRADRARRSTTSPTTTRRSRRRTAGAATAQLLYGNWINEIYQTTPYELDADRRLTGAGSSRAAARRWRPARRGRCGRASGDRRDGRRRRRADLPASASAPARRSC